MVPSRNRVTIFTDGACLGNPDRELGRGSSLRPAPEGTFRRLLSDDEQPHGAPGGHPGLEALKKPCDAVLITDSQYVFNGIDKGWAKRWKEKGWMRSRREKAQNADLWEKLLELCERHRVRFQWVRGHAGNVENERCDRLAREAAMQPDLPADSGYRP
jgi:ribonuclease HI